jgi:DHA2 family multidrug resistance protein
MADEAASPPPGRVAPPRSAPERVPLPRSAAGRHSPWLIAIIVSIATFMEVLDSTIANVSLRHIAGSLSASQEESTWVLTSYLVSNAIVLPISGWLANVVGRKRFYMICVALFTVSSALCAMSTSLNFMLAMRVLQGLGGGGLAPVEQSIFADTFPPAMRAKAFALYGLTILVAPALGPILGGYLTDNFSWHWVFLINLPVGILSLCLTWIFVDEPVALREERKQLLAGGLKVDYLGFALVAVGFGSMQVVLDQFEQQDGFQSGFIIGLSALCVSSLAFLLVWEWDHPHPAVALRLLGIRGFGISNLVMFVIGFMLMSTTQLLPQLTQSLLGYDATTAGLTLGIGGMLTIFLMPVAGILSSGVVQPRILLSVALIVSGLALLHIAHFSLDVNFWDISLARTWQVLPLPFLFIPITAVSYIGLPPNRSNEASAIINLTRNLGGSIGVAFATLWLQYRTQFHTERLSEHITPYSDLHGQSLAQLGHAVQTQASIMSYLDIFWVLGLIALTIWPVTLLLKGAPRGAPVHGH